MRQTRAGSVAAGTCRRPRPRRTSSGLCPSLGGDGVSADDVTTLPAVLRTIVLAHRRMATHRPQGESVVGTSTSGLGRRNVLRRHHGRDAVRRGVAAGGVRSHRSARQAGGAPRRHRPPRRIRQLSSRYSRRDSRGPVRRPSCGSVSMSTRCRSTRRRRSWRSCAQCFSDVRDVARRPGRPRRGGTVGGRRARRHASLRDGRDRRAGCRATDRVARGRALRPPRPSPLRPPVTSIRAGSGLGVLRREEVARRVFDGVAPDPSEDGDILVLTRAGTASRVFRPVHPSVLAVRITDRTGRAVREHRFLGALTRAALHEDVLAIPRIGRRVRASVHRAGVHLESYTGQRMLEVIAEYPREDLFWAGEELLHDLAAGVPALTQPRRMRLFVGREPFRRFFSCLVYLPRDRYSTRARRAMEEVLLHELRGWRIEHSARIGGESRLAAVHFTVYTTAAEPPARPEPPAGPARRRDPHVGRVGARRGGRARPGRRRPARRRSRRRTRAMSTRSRPWPISG